MAFGSNDMNLVAEKFGELMDQGVELDTIMLAVCGLYIGTYYHENGMTGKTQEEIAKVAEKEIGLYLQGILGSMVPMLGLNPLDKRVPLIMASVITTVLANKGVGAGPNLVNPGQFDPRLDRPQGNSSLDQIMRDIEKRHGKDGS